MGDWLTDGQVRPDCPLSTGSGWLTGWVTKHIIVDGSNIATEGRSEPSLAQLNDAVLAFMAEHKGAKVTVIVDATFGHRIAKKERAAFDEAIANNELVAPPAGAVGRGDAFILNAAEKTGASILSNDSYQEFHGKYKWLFDAGRLIGGKPVPHVGWVFVERLPVRGQTSRRSVKAGGVVPKELPKASPEASKPMPVPKAPPPNAKLAASKQPGRAAAAPAPKDPPAPRNTMANEVLPYIAFVEKNKVGSKVKAVVESYAANGVTVRIGDVAGYMPLRNMASPQPRSAREMFKIGDAVTLMIVGYTPSRRSVDMGVPEVVAEHVQKMIDAVKAAPSRTAAKKVKKAAKKAVKKAVKKSAEPAAKTAPAKAAPAKSTRSAPAKKVAAAKPAAPAKKTAKKAAAVKAAPVKKTAPAKKVAKKK